MGCGGSLSAKSGARLAAFLGYGKAKRAVLIGDPRPKIGSLPSLGRASLLCRPFAMAMARPLSRGGYYPWRGLRNYGNPWRNCIYAKSRKPRRDSIRYWTVRNPRKHRNACRYPTAKGIRQSRFRIEWKTVV